MDKQMPGFLLIELLNACFWACLGLTLFIRWQSIMIERKAKALHKLNLIALIDSSLEQISIENKFDPQGKKIFKKDHLRCSIKIIALNDLDFLLSKAGTEKSFRFIELTLENQSSPYKAYKGLV